MTCIHTLRQQKNGFVKRRVHSRLTTEPAVAISGSRFRCVGLAESHLMTSDDNYGRSSHEETCS